MSEYADMAELADALASGASGGNFVQVQLLLSAPCKKARIYSSFLLFTITFHRSLSMEPQIPLHFEDFMPKESGI